MSDYGYNIKHILMVDIILDASGRGTMNEINAAQRLQITSRYKGEADKVPLVKKAEAEAEAKKYMGGVGVARQRQAIIDGLRENILNFSHKVEGTSTKEVMDMILATQYFDTIRDIGSLSKNTTVFLPHCPLGHVRYISSQVRNEMMEAASAQAGFMNDTTMDMNLLQ